MEGATLTFCPAAMTWAYCFLTGVWLVHDADFVPCYRYNDN